MTDLAIPILIAVVAGIAVALQGQFMGTTDRIAGTATSVFITYGVGGAIAAMIWLARGGPLQNVRQVPWYAWTAGALGLVIVGGIGYAAPRLGLSRTLVITVAAQLLAALLIDRALDAPRAIGFALTVAGVWLIVR
jgi:transporter family-2 protein